MKKKHIRLTTKLVLTFLLLALVSILLMVFKIRQDFRPHQGKETEQVEEKDTTEIAQRREEYNNQKKKPSQDGGISYHPSDDVAIYTEKDAKPDQVSNEREAKALLVQMEKELDIDNAEEEYFVSSTLESDSGTIYVFQQTFHDFDVAGSQIRMLVDEDNNVLSVSGSHRKVYGTEYENLMSDSDASQLFQEYVESNYEPETEDYRNYKPRKQIMLGKDGYFVAYIYSYGTDEIVIDAAGASVYGAYDTTNYAMTTVKAVGYSGKVEIPVNQTYNEHYKLEDTDRHIIVYDCPTGTLRYTTSATNQNIKELDSDTVEAISWAANQEDSTPPGENAVTAMRSICDIYDFFSEKLHIQGPSPAISSSLPLQVVVGAHNLNGEDRIDNATMSGYTLMTFYHTSSGKEYSRYTDVTAHEYTHGIEHGWMDVFDFSNTEILPKGEGGDYQTTIQCGIGEGVSDIFGILAADYVKDGKMDNDYEWKLSENMRNLKDPSKSDGGGTYYINYQQFINDGGIENAGTTSGVDCHYSSTLLSHPAYLMSNGIDGTGNKKIDNETLLKLWFDALISHTDYGDSFLKIRYSLEDTAILYNVQNKLEDKQLECVLDAFDRVGLGYHVNQTTGQIIDTQTERYDYALNTKSTVKVYDKYNDLYDNYKLKVYKKYDTAHPVVSEDIETDSYELNLDPGIYTFVISDNNKNSDLSYAYNVLVNDNDKKDLVDDYSSTGEFFTDFRSDCRQVVLVLDRSGSMAGTPMDETKAAAKNFVHTVFDQSPNSKISVISYADGSSTEIANSSSERHLSAAIDAIRSGGGTNMHSGVSSAYSILKDAKANIKLCVVLSDGLPNVGEDNSGDYNTPVESVCTSMKDDGIIIYSLGFFHNSNEQELETGTRLMNNIASPGNAYTITSADEVAFTFDSIADDATQGPKIVIKLECPVDVEVTHEGQTLRSGKKEITEADFGRLIVDEEAESKTLYLDPSEEYEVIITGNGDGHMDYTITWPEEGEEAHARSFQNVPIHKSTVISTYTETEGGEEDPLVMNVDDDGDGKFETVLKAKEDANVNAAEARTKDAVDYLPYILKALALLLAIYLLLELIFIIRLGSSVSHTCSRCGTNIKGQKFCPNCGTKVESRSFWGEIRYYYKRQSTLWRICKLILVAVLGIVIFGSSQVTKTAAYSEHLQRYQGHEETAERIYKTAVQGNRIEELSLKVLEKTIRLPEKSAGEDVAPGGGTVTEKGDSADGE